MNTPVADFVHHYAASHVSRLHMPGHKGIPLLGCEALDITEVAGADALYEADGILDESERNASALFGAARTLFSTEGSSQCIRAMLYLALLNRPVGTPPVIVAARNVHKSFIFAAGLLDFQVIWLWPEEEVHSLCCCRVSAQALDHTLARLAVPPAAVYVTSPDYLGGQTDIAALAEICHHYHTLLIVDNAHGAYLHFLNPPCHPLDLGADICCDSAHKTLPVLTGGAYLHIGNTVPQEFIEGAKSAMALFGSTSPSYLTLASLDLCNAYLSEGYARRLADTVERLWILRQQLDAKGWKCLDSDPLKLTLNASLAGVTGPRLAEQLREAGVECEYADLEFVVLMVTPENTEEDFIRVAQALRKIRPRACASDPLVLPKEERVLSIRQALLSRQEILSVKASIGRICGAPTVSCPPAIPIVVSGERIGPDALKIFERYGITHVSVVKN